MSELREIAAGVRLLALRTPTLPPATATNTLVVGRKRLAVIEPATPYADERAALDELLGALVGTGADVAAILLTHHPQTCGLSEPARNNRRLRVVSVTQAITHADGQSDDVLDGST